MVSRVQLSATTSRPLVLRQDPDADLSRYTTTGKGKTHGGMTTGDSHMGFKTASTVCPIKSQLIHFKLSQDPAFAAKLRDVVGLYLDPPAHSLVLSVDEKSQIQALDRTQPGLPIKRGRAG